VANKTIGAGKDYTTVTAWEAWLDDAQLTEDQYNYWSTQKQVLLVEFDCAHKISVIRIAPDKITARSDWIAFEDFRS